VSERTTYLFGRQEEPSKARGRRKKKRQMSLFVALEQASRQAGLDNVSAPTPGETTLDKVHQAMILFAAGRATAVRRFLVEEGVGRSTQFWKLAQALSALYPTNTEEKRWVDGVLARKTSLGFGAREAQP